MSTPFEKRLDGITILSLDVFDTILGRRCAYPEDVFSIMEAELVAAHGITFAGFADFRKKADTKARRHAWDTRQSEEIQIDDIFTVLYAERPEWKSLVPNLADWEMEIEKRMLYLLPQAVEMVASARKQGKGVILVSDMYLSKAFCEARLRDNGFTDYDAFYLSSEVGKLKHTGRLFEHVLQQTGCPANEILHIGDNFKTDVKQARAKGLQASHIPRSMESVDQFIRNPLSSLAEQPERTTEESLLLGLSAKGCAEDAQLDDPFWGRIGYQVGGPLVCGYVRFLIEKVRGRGIETIYFLSRDGYILKQVYECLTSDIVDCPKADYLYASRRALNIAAITELDQITEDWLVQGIHLTVGDFLERVGLTPSEHLSAIQSCGFRDSAHPVVGGHEYDSLRRLFRTIFPSLREVAKKEKDAYIAYLDEKGVTRAKPFIIVDVGWMTSIQHSFEKLLSPNYPDLQLEGYYLGSYPEAIGRAKAHSTHTHYLMEYGHPSTAMETIRHCVGLVEFFFTAPEHSFLYMKRESDGTISPVFSARHDNEKDLSALAELRRSILEYATQSKHSTFPDGFFITPEHVLKLLHRLLAKPTREEAERLGAIQYADGYGAYFHHTHMARIEKISRLGLGKERWKAAFKASHWRKGYYMQMGLIRKLLFRLFHPVPNFLKPYR